MKQTNIRIDDYFVMKNNNQYFLSDIDDYGQWRETDNLLDHKKKNVTSKLSELMNKYNVKYNVNFLTGQSGGWPFAGPTDKKNQSGGWANNVFNKIQSGGSWTLTNK